MTPDRLGWAQPPLTSLDADPSRPDVDELWHAGAGRRVVKLLTPARRLFVLALPLLCLAVLGARLGYLQLSQSGLYQQLVERNQFRYVSVPAPRGAIVDRQGLPMVENAPNFTLTVIPASIPRRDPGKSTYIDRLSSLSGVSPEQLDTILSNKKYSRSDAIPIISHIPYQRALQLSVDIGDLSGASIDAFPTRYYRDGEANAAVIGYIGAVTEDELKANPKLTMVDEVGKTGIESRYNELLMGEPGFVAYERTGQNEFISPVRRRDPVPGKTIRLTIDDELQTRLYGRLKEEVTKLHSTGGAAVAVDPRTGEILALVSAPSYDSNWFINPELHDQAADAVTNPKRLLLNRAISGQYPSGSIIKPIIATAALAERVITTSTTVLSVGGFKVGVNYFPDWKAGGHGLTDVFKAIAESVNTFFYVVGGGYEQQAGLGVERIVKYLAAFGWGNKLGIDLPNESSGFLPTKEWRDTKRSSPWRLGDTYHLSIGQGDLDVTPLQIAMSTAAVANGGTLYRPHLVQEIDSPSGTVIQKAEPVVISDGLGTPAAISAVRQGMRQGVLSGSSRALQSLPVLSAGKTGTAQFGKEGKTHAWFSAFAPYDTPTIAIAVIVEGGGEGNAAALPVAKDVLQWYFTRSAPPAGD